MACICNVVSDRVWIERTIAKNDRDGDGGISLEEFIEMNIGRNRVKTQTQQQQQQVRITLGQRFDC